MKRCWFSSSTSNMVFGRAWVTTASRTTTSSFWTSPSGLLLVLRFPARRGLRLGVEDLAKSLSLRASRSERRREAERGGQRDPERGDLGNLAGLDPPDVELERAEAGRARPAGGARRG